MPKILATSTSDGIEVAEKILISGDTPVSEHTEIYHVDYQDTQIDITEAFGSYLDELGCPSTICMHLLYRWGINLGNDVITSVASQRISITNPNSFEIGSLFGNSIDINGDDFRFLSSTHGTMAIVKESDVWWLTSSVQDDDSNFLGFQEDEDYLISLTWEV